MKRFMTFIFFHYRSPLLILLFAIGLIVIRVFMTHSIFYTFLLWNLFLAVLPFLITQSILFYGLDKLSKFIRTLLFVSWILLLPNAPYLITDIVHLHNDYSHLKWLDLFIVFVFASIGLLFCILSLLDAHNFFTRLYHSRTANILIPFICLVSGYGIYLGRFLRYNSWDILFKTKAVIQEVILSLNKGYVWLMTFAFGMFIWLTFTLFKWIKDDL